MDVAKEARTFRNAEKEIIGITRLLEAVWC